MHWRLKNALFLRYCLKNAFAKNDKEKVVNSQSYNVNQIYNTTFYII